MSLGHDWMTQLGREIKEALEKRGWNQSDLARDSGVPQPTISNIVLGKSKHPKVENLEAIATSLDLDAEHLKVLAGIRKPSAVSPWTDGHNEAHRQTRISQWMGQIESMPEEYQNRYLELFSVAQQLTDRDFDTLIAMARTLIQQHPT